MTARVARLPKTLWQMPRRFLLSGTRHPAPGPPRFNGSVGLDGASLPVDVGVEGGEELGQVGIHLNDGLPGESAHGVAAEASEPAHDPTLLNGDSNVALQQ